MGKFIISIRRNGDFQFNLKANNGQIILSSEGYTTKAACVNGIESVKTNGLKEERFDRKTSSNGKYYFNLKATNGQIIGTSELYETVEGRENGIGIVKDNVADALIEEIA